MRRFLRTPFFWSGIEKESREEVVRTEEDMHALNEGKWPSEMEESKIQQASEEGPYLH